ncbi:MAG TPA: hypothetical protein QF572_10805 [Vicinamibacterales bacterium]|nr:hypothetical protein [Vicinamibacterales bacterium]
MTNRPQISSRARANGESGFMLMETIFSLGLLSVGLLAIAAVFSQGLLNLQASSNIPLAKQKAVETIESVFTSRDTRIVSWAQVRNQSDGGIFLDGDQAIRVPGPDGLVNTNDDGAVEQMSLPGADNLVGTGDDRQIPLTGFTRRVEILAITPNLREVRVTITYPQGDGARTYTLSTYMSSFA